MRIGVLRTQVPFISGGAERHAANLVTALNAHGHQATEITFPFKWYPGEILADHIEMEHARTYLLPLLKQLLTDDNDSVKIQAVYSAVTVARLLKDSQLLRQEVIPPFKVAVENKMASWRLRFAVGEIAAQMAEHMEREYVDQDVVALYENLL